MEMNYITAGWNWLVFSSADPKRVSLTLRGFLVALATYTTVLAGIAHVQLPSDLITQLIEGVVSLVQQLLMLVSTAITIIGIVRKIAKTFAGTNKVLAD
jgi:hypothetical protein